LEQACREVLLQVVVRNEVEVSDSRLKTAWIEGLGGSSVINTDTDGISNDNLKATD
jgi:hypothetical protein